MGPLYILRGHTGYNFKHNIIFLSLKIDFVLERIQREWGENRGGGESQKYSFFSNTGPDPLKCQSYQAIIRCRVIIGTPAKAIEMAFRWRADDDPLIVLSGSSYQKRLQSWTPSYKTLWICACKSTRSGVSGQQRAKNDACDLPRKTPCYSSNVYLYGAVFLLYSYGSVQTYYASLSGPEFQQLSCHL